MNKTEENFDQVICAKWISSPLVFMRVGNGGSPRTEG